MSIAEIKMEWGGTKWRSTHKKAVRPYVKSATQLTSDGLEHLRIPMETDKTATVFRASDGFADLGCAIDESRYHLYVRELDVRRNKVYRSFCSIVATSIHEVMHCIRMERMESENTDNLLECIISEGLSYSAEYEVSRYLLSPQEMHEEYGELFKPMSDGVFNDLRRHAIEDSEQKLDDETYGIWLDNGPGGGNFTAGNRLGVFVVGRLLESGKSFSELIGMSADQIINAR